MSDDAYLRKEFSTIDTSGTGKISTDEFRRLVFGNESLQGFRDESINTYIAELSHHTGYITFDQFKQFMQAETESFNNPLVIAELRQAFNEVDVNKDGFISTGEARKCITLAGQRIPGISFDQIARQFDDNGDGQLSLQEFLENFKRILHK